MEDEASNLPESLEPYGDGVSEDRVNLMNTRLMARAIRENWGIKEEDRHAIAAEVVKIVKDPTSHVRAKIAAAKAIVEMVGQDQQAAQKAVDKIAPDKHSHEHSGQVAVQLYLPEKQNTSPPPPPGINGSNGHTNGHH